MHLRLAMSIFAQNIEENVPNSFIAPGSVFWEEYLQHLPDELKSFYDGETLELDLSDFGQYKSLNVRNSELFPPKILSKGLKYVRLKNINLRAQCDELDGDGTSWVTDNFWFDGNILKNIKVNTKKFNDDSSIRLNAKHISDLELNTGLLVLPFSWIETGHPWGAHIPESSGNIVINEDASVQIHMQYASKALEDIDNILRCPKCWDDSGWNTFHSQSNMQLKYDVNLMDILQLPSWLRGLHSYEIYFNSPYHNITNIKVSKSLMLRSSHIYMASDFESVPNYLSADEYYLYL